MNNINNIALIKTKKLFKYLFIRVCLRFLPKIFLRIPKSIYFNNFLINIDNNDLEQKYFSLDCIREPENLIVYKAIAINNIVDTFVDIGGNCGHVSLSIVNDYKKIILFEPNPRLFFFLTKLFKKYKHVKLRQCAIVQDNSVGYLNLNVPKSSSGLATLGNFLVKDNLDFNSYKVEASTLKKEINMKYLYNAYIKIDVEGLEKQILISMIPILETCRPIVGFEALSKHHAKDCISIFKNYVFYCSRFDFLGNSGALTKSIYGILKALLFGGNIKVIRLDNFDENQLDNFSQIFAVPKEKSFDFEKSIKDYFKYLGSCNLEEFKTWSKY